MNVSDYWVNYYDHDNEMQRIRERQEQAAKVRRAVEAEAKQREQQKEKQMSQDTKQWCVSLKGNSCMLMIHFSTEAEATERARTLATAFPGKTYQVFSVRHEFTYKPAAMTVTSF